MNNMEQKKMGADSDLNEFLTDAEEDYNNSRRESISHVENLEDLALLIENELFGKIKNDRGELRSGVEQASSIRDFVQLVKDKKIDVNNNETLNLFLKHITTALGIREKVEELIKKL